MNYNMPNPAENDISNWLIKNPQRLNLARTGFSFWNLNVTEVDLQQKSQELDLWSGKISSSFVYNDTSVAVETVVDPVSDTVAISVESKLFHCITSRQYGFRENRPPSDPELHGAECKANGLMESSLLFSPPAYRPRLRPSLLESLKLMPSCS